MTHVRWGQKTPWLKVAGAATLSLGLFTCAGAVEPDTPWAYGSDPADGSWMECRDDACQNLGVEDPYDHVLVDPGTYPEAFRDLAVWFQDNGMDMEAMHAYLREFHPELLGVEPLAVDPCEGPASHDAMMSAYDTANMSVATGAAEGHMRDVACY